MTLHAAVIQRLTSKLIYTYMAAEGEFDDLSESLSAPAGLAYSWSKKNEKVIILFHQHQSLTKTKLIVYFNTSIKIIFTSFHNQSRGFHWALTRSKWWSTWSMWWSTRSAGESTRSMSSGLVWRSTGPTWWPRELLFRCRWPLTLNKEIYL